MQALLASILPPSRSSSGCVRVNHQSISTTYAPLWRAPGDLCTVIPMMMKGRILFLKTSEGQHRSGTTEVVKPMLAFARFSKGQFKLINNRGYPAVKSCQATSYARTRAKKSINAQQCDQCNLWSLVFPSVTSLSQCHQTFLESGKAKSQVR